VSPQVERLAWISPDVALFVATFGKEAPSAEATLDGRPAKVRFFGLGGQPGNLQIGTLARQVGQLGGERIGRLTFRHRRSEIGVEPAELGEASTDPQTLVRTYLAPLPVATRSQVLEFLAATQAAYPAAAGPALTRSLYAIREALRERLTPCIVARDKPVGLAVECVLAIDERRFFVQGWFRDSDSPATSLRAASPEGASAELLPTAFRFRRPDLEAFYGVPVGDESAGVGFACCFDLPAPSIASGGWIFELRTAKGAAVEVPGPLVITTPGEVRNMLLSDIGLERPGEDVLTRDHLFPALSRLQEHNAQRLRIDRLIQFGDPPNDPEVTVIVPLYRRIDFLQHQLAQFSLDPGVSRSDLIYVLDSPELARDLVEFSAALFDLYRVPFRVALLGQNVGYAGANRAGASLARGRRLLFLNSDVLPERPGWIQAMSSFYDLIPHIGALGPKLMFEDDSLQHAGLFFRRRVQSAFWVNDHYFKGMHRDTVAANVSRVVPAVTGACMMVDRTLFEGVGGFSGGFVRGDFEDSDFCLRLAERGLQNYYLADVALYHLEGQSYEAPLRVQSSRYNAWLQTFLWGSHIAGLMKSFDAAVEEGHLPLPKFASNGNITDEVAL
jgi:GT2 family glycosyltransferase